LIHRRIFKVKTTGSRAHPENPLRPAWTDEFVARHGKGINYVVHEYNEDEGWCIVECWCSDHPCCEPTERKSKADLEALEKDADVLEVLPSHPRSPPILGIVATSVHESVDEERKEIVVRGRVGTFKRKIRHFTTAGEEEDLYILDEG